MTSLEVAMDLELAARRSDRGPYIVLPQQEHRRPRTPISIGDEEFTTTSNVGPRTGHSDSISKSYLATVESRDSTSKLPAKSFSQTPTIKRIYVHFATATVALLLVGLPIGVFIAILEVNSIQSDGPSHTYCTVGNNYDPDSSTNSSFATIWNVDTVFGRMSFGMAKFIDLVWDIGFSRCGQAMLGWVTYRVNSSALLRIMETHPVSYEFFSTLSLSSPSLSCLIPAIKTFFTHLGFRKKLIVFWIFLSIVWVATWPTITNAMTGYVAENNTLVKIQDSDGYIDISNLTSSDNLAFQCFSPHNNVTSLDSTKIDPTIIYKNGSDPQLWKDMSRDFPASFDFGTYDYYVWNGTRCEAFYYYQSQKYYPYLYLNTGGNVQCVATGVYQWGFSTVILWCFMYINGFWIIGTYAVWVHMNRKSEMCRKGRRLGQYRAAMDMVESIQEDLGKNTCAYSEEELQAELKKQGRIKYYFEHGTDDAPSHIGISSSRDKRKVSIRYGEAYGRYRAKIS